MKPILLGQLLPIVSKPYTSYPLVTSTPDVTATSEPGLVHDVTRYDKS